MKSKTRYKLQRGVQAITPDTPDYSKAYELQAQQGAVNKGISQAAGMFSGAYAPIGQLGGMAADVIRNRAKDKEKGATIGGAVEMGSTGAALGTAIAPGIGTVIGLAGGAIYGGMKGKKNYEKVKAAAQQEEKRTAFANANKYYHAGAETDAQSFLAKKGKYKVKSKQPRLIETEGREPIFSPKKPDGTRDLLYYNPNDPTHEEGGVKAVVMPKAQMGKRKTKADTISTYIKPLPNQYEMEQDKRMASNKAAGRKGLEYTFDDDPYAEDSASEEGLSIIDPTGVSNWDNVARSYKNYKESKGRFDKTIAGIGLGMDVFSAIPLVGKTTVPFKMSRWALSKVLSKLPKGEGIANAIYKSAEKEALPAAKGLWQKTKRFGKNVLKRGFEGADEFSDLDRALRIKEEISGKEIDKKSDKTIGDLISGKAYGAKQLKVNDLNTTSLSQNLVGIPSPNAANKFVQPMAGIQQVARQIPEERRKEKQNTPRSHKKENPDTNRIIDPPMLYEMKPPPPRSTFNTKNDFNKGSKKVKVYR